MTASVRKAVTVHRRRPVQPAWLIVLALAGEGACSSDSPGATPPDAAISETGGGADAADAAAERSANATPADASDGSADASDASDAMTFAVCLADRSPTFTNLRTNLFPVSCTTGSLCHGTAAATEPTLRGGGGLDLESDVYTHLLGADGAGAPAANLEGAARNLVRVKPGDPDNSFLLIKLQLQTNSDNNYGSGMPFTAPGSVCPETLSTIRTWIALGAANN
jgi:hypothetical protein